MEGQKPSICRIVVYNHPVVPHQSPAVIQSVALDGSVRLTVFGASIPVFIQEAVEQGDGPGQWNWPPRV